MSGRLIIAISIALFAAACAKYDEKGRRVDTDGRFYYAVFDGHEYVVAANCGGIAHSPKCECRHKEQSK